MNVQKSIRLPFHSPRPYTACMEPGLYLVGTPIGNLGDLTFRALDTLRDADIVLAEDTRQTRKLFSRYGIETRLMSCHKFNEAARIELICGRIQRGEAVALVTDAGMPGVSDPGGRMVAACRGAALSVTAIPGPSAVSTAVAQCGFLVGGFVFEGFLPVKSGGRRNRLERLADEDRAVVLFESPHRLIRLLETMHDVMPRRRAFVGRELTKRFEECRVGTSEELLEAYQGRTVKGEVVLVLEPLRRRASSSANTELTSS